MSGITVRGKLDLGRRSEEHVAKADVPKPPSPLARRLALAHRIERLVEEGVFRDYSDAARQLDITPARMTQVMNLLALSPKIQEAILMGVETRSERDLRRLLNEPQDRPPRG